MGLTLWLPARRVDGRLEVPTGPSGPGDPYLGRKLDPHLDVPGVDALMRDPRMIRFRHANRVHGGSRRKDLRPSRKALVTHYLAEGLLTCHDLSGDLTRLPSRGLYAPIKA